MTSWLHEQRLADTHEAIRRCGARTVLDLGCGDGDLLVRLAREPKIERVVGVDICGTSLERLRGRLKALEGAATAQVDLVHGSIIEGSPIGSGFDCAVLVEIIEHIDPNRLSVLERAVFAGLKTTTVVVTTPNAEFNPLLGVPAHRFRHPDHRFEWDRRKFRRWASGVARRNGYQVDCSDIAGRHPTHGGASQMAVFTAAANRPP